MKYQFADLKVDFTSEFDELFKVAFRNYSAEYETADLAFEINTEDLEYEKNIDEEAKNVKHIYTLANTSALRKIGEKRRFHRNLYRYFQRRHPFGD